MSIEDSTCVIYETQPKVGAQGISATCCTTLIFMIVTLGCLYAGPINKHSEMSLASEGLEYSIIDKEAM